MSTTVPVNEDLPEKDKNAPHRRRGNRLALAALPLIFLFAPWVLAVSVPEQVTVTVILVGTPLTLAALAAYDAATYRPSLTFCLLAVACMWLATKLFYPDGAGWYVLLVALIYALVAFPWRQKFKDEWGRRTEEEGE